MADISGTDEDLAMALMVEIVPIDMHKMNVVRWLYEWKFLRYEEKTEILTFNLPISPKQEVVFWRHFEVE